jgi:hypothetical protein
MTCPKCHHELRVDRESVREITGTTTLAGGRLHCSLGCTSVWSIVTMPRPAVRPDRRGHYRRTIQQRQAAAGAAKARAQAAAAAKRVS